MKRLLLAILCVVGIASLASGQGTPEKLPEVGNQEGVQKDISYLGEAAGDTYAAAQCKLDVYWPRTSVVRPPLLVWFHGGALKGGSKTGKVSVAVAKSFADRGVVVILPEYRFSPQVSFPSYVQDAAKAVRWALDHAKDFGARTPVYVGGHSAGGYLAALLAMDPKFLEEAGVKPGEIAGFISMSGQMMTHFTVAEERGKGANVIMADDAAPIHHLRKDIAPLLVLAADKDWPARLEENAYFVRAMRDVAGCRNLSFQVIENRDHSTILSKAAETEDPAAVAILGFIRSGTLPPDSTPNSMPMQPSPSGADSGRQ